MAPKGGKMEDTHIIIADRYRSEIGELTISKNLDMKTGENNDFEFT